MQPHELSIRQQGVPPQLGHDDALHLQVPPWQVSMPVHALPHMPQLLLSLEVLAQTPASHGVYPELHVTAHPLDIHIGEALAIFVEQTVPHPPQWFTSFVRFTQASPHSVGVDDEQPDTHVYAPPSAPELEQRGVPASALHTWPQPPQFDAVVSSTHVFPQSE